MVGIMPRLIASSDSSGRAFFSPSNVHYSIVAAGETSSASTRLWRPEQTQFVGFAAICKTATRNISKITGAGSGNEGLCAPPSSRPVGRCNTLSKTCSMSHLEASSHRRQHTCNKSFKSRSFRTWSTTLPASQEKISWYMADAGLSPAGSCFNVRSLVDHGRFRVLSRNEHWRTE